MFSDLVDYSLPVSGLVVGPFVNLIYFCSLAFSFFFRERNPITTKFELIFLGMVGLLWLSEFPFLSVPTFPAYVFIVLGVYLATSDAQSADVECFADNSQTPLDDELASCKYLASFDHPSHF